MKFPGFACSVTAVHLVAFWAVGALGIGSEAGTQGMRDRKTLKVRYPLLNKKSPAGEVNPAMQQLDFYIRSPETDERNNPPRKVFDHFFAMEVTWK